jgi:hypothetical protein
MRHDVPFCEGGSAAKAEHRKGKSVFIRQSSHQLRIMNVLALLREVLRRKTAIPEGGKASALRNIRTTYLTTGDLISCSGLNMSFFEPRWLVYLESSRSIFSGATCPA